MSRPIIEATHITKRFDKVTALDDVSLRAEQGTVLGLLGHNGAGKTTLINILSTLLPPTSGTATVAGYDVVRQSRRVCARIGLTGQFASVDEQLSGFENLVLIARLLGANNREARRRAEELLELFDLTEASKRPARTYSGGMRRRLDLSAGLVGRPDVVFLDEPTTGLDPVSRMGMWRIVEGLVRDGTTVLLTTQYLDEADRLADSITVLSGGRIVASGTAAQLKSEVGQRSVTLSLTRPTEASKAVRALAAAGLNPSVDEEHTTVVTPVRAAGDLPEVVRALDEQSIEIADLALGEPTLDDVYLALAHRERQPATSQGGMA